MDGKKIPGIENGFNQAVAFLKFRNKNVVSAWVLRRVHPHFNIKFDSIEEVTMSKNFNNAIKTFGDALSGDKKLFQYTGDSGFVRKLLSKPARIGLWHFQLVTKFSNGKPYLLFMRMHLILKKHLRSIRCHEIMSQWADIVSKKPASDHCIIFCDSYYLTEESRALYKEKKLVLLQASSHIDLIFYVMV